MTAPRRVAALLGRAPSREGWTVGPPAGAAVTRGAPHVRAGPDLATVMRCVVVALVPCVFAALYNAGYQANEAIDDLALDAAPGWRGVALDALGIAPDPDGPLACTVHGLLLLAPVYAVAAIVGVAWQALFERLRRRAAASGLSVTALVFALSLPPAIPLWQVALGMSFGVVIAKEIFGGTGRNFVNPAVAGLAFLFFAYPGQMSGEEVWVAVDGYSGATALALAADGGPSLLARDGPTWWESFAGRTPGAFGETSALACLVGAALLLATGAASWRILAGGVAGLAATALLFGALGDTARPWLGVPWYWHFTLGSFAFGLVFLATDPVTAATTNPGRWVYGALIGALVVLTRIANPAHPEGVLLAILVGNVFAPLIDRVVAHGNARRRLRRLG